MTLSMEEPLPLSHEKGPGAGGAWVHRVGPTSFEVGDPWSGEDGHKGNGG